MADKRCSGKFPFCWCENENRVWFFQYAACNYPTAELFTVIVLFRQIQQEIQLEIFLGEYLPIAVFFAIAIGLSAAFVLSAFVLGNQRPDDEKMAAYECGFDAFDDSRRQFDVRFYLVAILFIIFDLEVAFLFPWAVALGGIGLFGFWSMMLFLAVLTVGFIYEWKKGALEWE